MPYMLRKTRLAKRTLSLGISFNAVFQNNVKVIFIQSYISLILLKVGLILGQSLDIDLV